jgi:hypothetical protein
MLLCAFLNVKRITLHFKKFSIDAKEEGFLVSYWLLDNIIN